MTGRNASMLRLTPRPVIVAELATGLWLRVVHVVVAAAEVKLDAAPRPRPGLMAGISLGSRQATSTSGIRSRVWT